MRVTNGLIYVCATVTRAETAGLLLSVVVCDWKADGDPRPFAERAVDLKATAVGLCDDPAQVQPQADASAAALT